LINFQNVSIYLPDAAPTSMVQDVRSFRG